jgi:hypothetical protein
MGEGGDIPYGNGADLVSAAIHTRSSHIRLSETKGGTTAPALRTVPHDPDLSR